MGENQVAISIGIKNTATLSTSGSMFLTACMASASVIFGLAWVAICKACASLSIKKLTAITYTKQPKPSHSKGFNLGCNFANNWLILNGFLVSSAWYNKAAAAIKSGQHSMVITAKNCSPGVDGIIIKNSTYTNASTNQRRGDCLNKVIHSLTQPRLVLGWDSKIAMVTNSLNVAVKYF